MQWNEFNDELFGKVLKKNKRFVDKFKEKKLLCYIISVLNNFDKNKCDEFKEQDENFINKILSTATTKFKKQYKIFYGNNDCGCPKEKANYIILGTFPGRATLTINEYLRRNNYGPIYYLDKSNSFRDTLGYTFTKTDIDKKIKKKNERLYKNIIDLTEMIDNDLSIATGTSLWRRIENINEYIDKKIEENLKKLSQAQADFCTYYSICLTDRVAVCLCNEDSSLDKNRLPLVYNDFSNLKNGCVIVLNGAIGDYYGNDPKDLMQRLNVKGFNLREVLYNYSGDKKWSDIGPKKSGNEGLGVTLYFKKDNPWNLKNKHNNIIEIYEQYKSKYLPKKSLLYIYNLDSEIMLEQFKGIINNKKKQYLVAVRCSTSKTNGGQSLILKENRKTIPNEYDNMQE